MTDDNTTADNSEPTVHSDNDRIVAELNGNTLEGNWQAMKRLGQHLVREAESHKTDLQKAAEMGAGAHIRISCDHCDVTQEEEYKRDLYELPEDHVDHPDFDCTLDDVTVEAFCPRHGTIPLAYDECDSCASDRAMMVR